MGLLEKLGEKIAAAVASRIRAPDLSSFGDPLALEVPWKKLEKSKAGAANFKNTKLVDDGAGKLRLVRSIQGTLFTLVFAIPGVIFTGLGLVKLSPFALFGLPFAAVGVYLLWPRERLFDRNAREIVLGDDRLPFEAVHALQLIEHWESGDSDSPGYYSYQLNLVMKDRSRRALADHSSLESIREDARKLSGHLGCRLWDGPGAPQLTGEAAIKALTAGEEKPA